MEKQQNKPNQKREDLTGEHTFGDAGQLILFFLFMAIWILDSFVYKYSTFLSDQTPWYIRIPVAAVIFFISGWMARSGLKIVFGQVREQPHVITEGVFSMVRHPVYLGAILLYLALIISTLSITSFIFWLVIIVFYVYISKTEEKLLTNRFGEEYKEYMKKVPMLFPVIRNVK